MTYQFIVTIYTDNRKTAKIVRDEAAAAIEDFTAGTALPLQGITIGEPTTVYLKPHNPKGPKPK
jgi:hypothetical protein